MITNSSLPSERLAFAHLAARRFEEAIEWADRALHEQPRFIVAIRAKIVANAHLGRLDEARADLGRMPAIAGGACALKRRNLGSQLSPRWRETDSNPRSP